MSSQKQREKQRLKRKEKKKERKRSESSHFANGILHLDPARFVTDEPVKMSEVLEDFVAPFWDECETDEASHKLLTIGMVAWNVCLMPEDKRDGMLHDVLATVPPDAREGMQLLLTILMFRKQTHFAHNTRMILDFRYESTPSGGNLQVISTMGGD